MEILDRMGRIYLNKTNSNQPSNTFSKA